MVFENFFGSEVPIFKKGKFNVNFPVAITEFDRIMQRLKLKKILYRIILRGKGLEFDSYRKFGFDDDASFIDWKASLRANQLLSRTYIEERDLNVYFLVDVSNSMLFGSRNKLKSEYVAEFVTALSHLVINVGDRIGLVMFSDSLVKVLHPSSKKTQFGLFMKFLSDPNLYGGGFDLDKVIDYVLKTVKSEYSVFFIISDFISLGESNQRNLRLLGTRFETMAVMSRDFLDENLPKTGYQFAFQDPYSKRQMVLDPEISSRRYRVKALEQKAKVKEIFENARIDVLELDIGKRFAVSTATFLKNRAGRRR